MKLRKASILQFTLIAAVLTANLSQPQTAVHAATTLTVTPITWNVIGLDSNDVSVGPNHFPIGARVCNTGGADASNVTADFVWDTSNTYINIRPGTNSNLSVSSLAIGACTDFYFEVEVTRNASAYDTTRSYHIAVTADAGATTGSTPAPRELYVDHLISQSRNSVTDMQLSTDGSSFTSVSIGGTMTLMVGETYWIKLVGATATNGYEQIESFINFPNTIFQVLSVSTSYSADTSSYVSNPDDKLYGDGCKWENNPSSPNYRSCLDVGKAGGNITVTYQVKILQIPSSPLVNPEPLSTLIYDFSGSSYHYNSDYGVSTRYVNIVNASITKAFSPKTITPGGTSTLTFTITDPGSNAITNVNFSDTFPSGMTVSGAQSPAYTGCGGSASPASLSGGETSLSFSGITVAAYSTCAISLSVTSSTSGTNTTGHLFINSSIDTGSYGTDSLVVSTKPTPPATCTTPLTLATWTMPTSGQGSGGPPPPYTTKATDVSSATAGNSGGTFAIDTAEGNLVNSWSGSGWPVTGTITPPNPAAIYYELTVDTSNYNGVRITFDYYMKSGEWANIGNNFTYLYSKADTGAFNSGTGYAATKGSWQTHATYTATSTGTSTTTFRISAVGAKATPSNGVLYIDNIAITGCPRPTPPTLSKSFAPVSIAQGGTSVLTFTITNPNTDASYTLNGISFSDTLPSGLSVADSTSSVCGGTNNLVTTAATRTISLTGGSLAPGGNCSFSVTVTGATAGQYTNISGSIGATESGPNTTSSGYGTSSLTVVTPPVIAKSFGSTFILTGNTTSLSFTITNPNLATALTGVAFTDSLPAGLVVATPNGLSGNCGGGTITATAGSSTVSLSGATLSANSSCTFSVNVQGTVAGDKTNSVQATSTNGGAGNTSTANVLVRAVTPKTTLLKQVSDSASGPWYDSRIIAAGSPVWYKFTVENTGDVALNPVTLTDDTFSPSCTWSNPTTPLPVAVAANDLHISTCIVQNGTATVGKTTNTAYATGTYGGAPYNSSNETATYQNGNFGHLPSAYTGMNLYNEGGAMHLNGTTYLGASVTANATDGINTATYTPKATDDGITWTGNWSSGTGYANATATCSPSGTRTLYAWFDWNNDKDFSDANETYSWTVNCSPGGTSNSISFTYPGGAALPAGTYYTRFRIYDTTPTNPQPYGIAKDGSGNPIVGEIEDPIITSSGLGNTPTPVTISYFRTQQNGKVVDFEWSTATETGNVGFNLYVKNDSGLTQINEELIPSVVVNSLERQDYSFNADVSGTAFYIDEKYGEQLEEEKVDHAAIQAEHAEKYAGRQTEIKKGMRNIPAAAFQEASGTQADRQLTTSLNLKVNKTGIYRVTYEMLRDAGLDLKGVPIAKITLANRGMMVPIYVSGNGKFGPGSYIEFYGEALDTLYTDTNIYILQVSKSPADRIQGNSAVPGNGLAPATTFTETLEANNQRGYANYAPGADPWYDTMMWVKTSPLNWSVPFRVTGLADPSNPASLTVTVWGGTSSAALVPDHHMMVSLNGVRLADETFDGVAEHTMVLSVPAGVLREGENTLQLRLPGDTGQKNEMVVLDRFSISYLRVFSAQDGRLTFTSTGKAFKVTNLHARDIIVYRIDQKGIARLGQVTVQKTGSTYTASFAGTNQSATYLVTAAGSLLSPTLEAAQVAVKLNQPAQYLIIAHPDFINGLQPLVQAHEAQGLTASVVNVNDLYTYFNNGVFDPQAIKKYIAYAAQNLGTQYVLLVGGDTYDYRNFLGNNSISFIPSLYASTGPLITFAPVDQLYADLNADNIPDLALGRFPVRSTAELDLMVAKSLVYMNKNNNPSAVFASDKYDGIVDFKGISNSLSAGIPAGWSVENIHLDDLSVSVARQRLLAAMNRGPALVTYTGHSGPLQWTYSNLFNTHDAKSLTNAGRPFVVVQWGCWNNYYVHPAYNYLVQSFLFSGDKGAVVVLGAVTLTNSESERLLGEIIMPRLVTPGLTIGQAMVAAKQELAQTHPELLDVLLGWSLMGDPALTIGL